MEEKEGYEGYELSFIKFIDDDNSIKEKVANVKKEIGGVLIRIQDSRPFFIPYGRVLKIKCKEFKT